MTAGGTVVLVLTFDRHRRHKHAHVGGGGKVPVEKGDGVGDPVPVVPPVVYRLKGAYEPAEKDEDAHGNAREVVARSPVSAR